MKNSVWIVAVLILGMTGFGCGNGSSVDPECSSDADCSSRGANWHCNTTTQECVCSPDCAGACCGDNGCGGTCDDSCADNGQTCNTASCECEGGGCTDGETQCSGDTVQTCSGGVFSDTTDCTATGQTCDAGACVGGGCTDGETQCSGDTVQTCSGGVFSDTTDCTATGQTCDAGACVGGGCTDGETQCSGDTVQTCSGGVFSDTTDCTATGQTCDAGACVGGGCTDGETQCSGDTVQTCSGGVFSDTTDCTATGQTCDAGACVGGGCTDGETQCSGDTVQTCSGGVFSDTTDCTATGQTCDAGACVGGGCTDGETQCSGDTVQTCSGGVFSDTTDCTATGQTCDAGACVGGGCTDGETQCSGDTVQTCVNNVFEDTLDCTTLGQGCDQGACVAGPYCGDGNCDIDEDTCICPADCAGSCCGDGTCDTDEDSSLCPADCAGVMDDCRWDDGIDPPLNPTAPDCEVGSYCIREGDIAVCLGDCAADPSVCDDPIYIDGCCLPAGGGVIVCAPGDWGYCPDPCGDGVCDPAIGEDQNTCPLDCGGGTCGDDICAADEDSITCPADCAGVMDPCWADLINPTAPNCEAGLVCINQGTDSHCAERCDSDPTLCDDPIYNNGCCAESTTGEMFCVNGDWGYCPDPCGDGVCDPAIGEDQNTCPLDCGGGTCGDDICAIDENSSTCPTDCAGVMEDCFWDDGIDPPLNPTAPDCEVGSYCIRDGDIALCMEDCGADSSVCDDPVYNDGCCYDSGTLFFCLDGDWGYCPDPCGDGVCDPAIGEDQNTCPLDCGGGTCGDDICAIDEDSSICPADCSGIMDPCPWDNGVDPPVNPTAPVCEAGLICVSDLVVSACTEECDTDPAVCDAPIYNSGCCYDSGTSLFCLDGNWGYCP